ncbi:MAG TPA: T9SS type A sorting domain-containing protein, partial [Saprospiraceae bacterium]|nr:T9SS type A sorting domain-containing protein [Saprospiraceae bacterium]
ALTCKNAIYSVAIDTVFVKVDSLVFSPQSSVTYKLMRMTTNYCLGIDTLPSDSIRLCCMDVGDTINVIVTATDISGTTTCMASIIVDDKLPPIIPDILPDVTVSCSFPINFNKLDTFGTYVHPDSNKRTIIIEDQMITDYSFYDYCEYVSVTSTYSDKRDCGTGAVERYITLTDQSNNVRLDTQNIYFINKNPFSVDNIIWPNDTTIILASGQCIGDNPPLNLGGQPIITGQSPCVMPSISKRDMVFNDPLSGCPYIMRTWRIVEMCTYRPNNHELGNYEYVQNIYIQDTIKPKFTSICKDTLFSDPNNGCEVLVNLSISALDNCTKNSDLLYSYEITDGHQIILTGNTRTINHTFALGNYTVTWIVDDRCGNTNTCTQNLKIADIKPPTPLANVSLVIGLPKACAVAIKADHFNVNSSDNCTPRHLLKYSFSADANDTIRTMNCDSLGSNKLEFWVTDLEGNQANVGINITVTDDYNYCPNNTVISIEGVVMADENVGIEEVKITLEGAEQQRSVMTKDDGSFSMSNLETNVSYFLTANKNGAFLDGVNILDLIELQKDFYGIKKFDNNRQKIAADIDGNRIIDHIDLSELRKIILGIRNYAEITPSWRVVDYSNMELSNPWPLKESFYFKDLDRNEHLKLQAIKIGDIDGTSVRKIQTRNDSKIVWYYPDQIFKAGETVIAKIHSSEQIPLTGVHMLLQYSSDIITYKNIKGINIDISNNDLNTHTKGELKICYVNARGNNIRTEGQVFEIEFIAQKGGKLSEVLDLSLLESSFAVNSMDEMLYLNLVSLSPSEKVLFAEQNVPNPFDKFTTIGFEVKENMGVEISIIDQLGRKIYNQYQNYNKGKHQIEISDLQLGENTGIFFVHIECAEISEIRKILRVK